MRTVYLSVFVALLSSWVQAADPHAISTQSPSEAGAKTPAKVLLLRQSKSGSKTGLKKVAYGGFLTDLARAEKLLQVVNPFSTARALPTAENLNIDPRTGKAEGFKLLSIKF